MGLPLVLAIVVLLAGSVPPLAAADLSAEELYNRLRSARQVQQFSGGHRLFILYDPRCPHCKTMFHRLMDARDEVRDAGVSVGWVPVAILGDRSNPLGQTHLKHGIGELKDHFQGDASEPSDDDRLERAIARNTDLMRNSAQVSGTPGLVFRTEDGVKVISGVPRGDYLSKVLRSVR